MTDVKQCEISPHLSHGEIQLSPHQSCGSDLHVIARRKVEPKIEPVEKRSKNWSSVMRQRCTLDTFAFDIVDLVQNVDNIDIVATVIVDIVYIDVDIVDHVDTKIIDTVGIANIVDIVNNVDNIDIVATLIGKILWFLYEKICGIFLLKRKVYFADIPFISSWTYVLRQNRLTPLYSKANTELNPPSPLFFFKL